MTVNVPQTWILMFGACAVAVLTIQLLDALGVPKWVQWVGAVALMVIAWVTIR